MSDRAQRSVAVAGGGLGGLAAALAFARMGWRATVVERAEALREVGAGIQLSPNAIKALDHLGVGDEARAAGFAPQAVELRAWRSGRLAWRLALNPQIERRHGAPYRQIHRADMLDILLRAALAAGVELRLGCEALGVSEDALQTDRGPLRADLIVGADGVRSRLRAAAGASSPRFSGNVAFRGLVRADRLPGGAAPPCATVWMGPRRHLVHYPLRGGEIVNFVAVIERAAWTEEGWSRPGDPEALRAEFADWHPQARAILDAADETFEWGLFGHAPLPSWRRGRLALLGDAAHPTTPFLAQGAAMAFEDAVVLSRAVAAHGVADGLAAYEAARKPRATRLQQAARRTGRRFHARTALDGLAKFAALELFARLAPGRAAALNDWIYGYDPARAPV
ncbi:FAD-dependent monooxygenase [Oceanicella actignis]|uniref:Salicylate hydroxylase n=1 Tax=Oceanicella actignis TaxID=1189325 RepID=A0A1M7TU51_9RHOB|nr:FAD-dependent monooxygenase [Oceanicella actignis]SES78035.1 salicylate hydroxylase [Oceanicella actignis]SHN74208.1 salicylate hydroxylase [Oceanicella actignis]